ncbi:ABC transporter permease [Melghirimyces algeriensis]|uniref:ABC-2 type transport system permease protein n=1 Tax=Melghirimyces algeriensis TaxID=910412 RepID=A0A521BFB9_9BACL|nr:ABC transporter permease [Melghirimyces algeriensis]SMO45410.1 hypothetical protein SAMN06264849_10231 [Melghirimyces algeriensis]
MHLPIPFRYFYTELLKMRWSMIGFIILLGVAISLWIGFGIPVKVNQGVNEWLAFFGFTVHKYTMFFYPLIIGIFAAWVCRYEHIGNGWKQIFCLPISPSHVYFAKLGTVALLTLMTQFGLLSGFLFIGWLSGLQDAVPWFTLFSKVVYGWFASLPLMTLMLGCSLLWKNFATPFTLNFIFTVPSTAIFSGSKMGFWYPWSQPFLVMMPKHEWAIEGTQMDLFIGVGGMFCLFVGATYLFFTKRDW